MGNSKLLLLEKLLGEVKDQRPERSYEMRRFAAHVRHRLLLIMGPDWAERLPSNTPSPMLATPDQYREYIVDTIFVLDDAIDWMKNGLEPTT